VALATAVFLVVLPSSAILERAGKRTTAVCGSRVGVKHTVGNHGGSVGTPDTAARGFVNGAPDLGLLDRGQAKPEAPHWKKNGRRCWCANGSAVFPTVF